MTDKLNKKRKRSRPEAPFTKRLEDATAEEVARAMFRAADRKIKRPTEK